MAKAIVVAFWLVAAPILGFGILYAVGETIEHFSRPTADELYGCTVQQQAPNGDCP